MLTKAQIQNAQDKAIKMLDGANIALTAKERGEVEVADFGLNELEQTGLELVVYINTDRYCAKELVLFPRQTCPEHRHPTISGEQGKMETFRCRKGKVFLCIPGSTPAKCNAIPVAGGSYTVFNEIVLNPGDQYTIPSNTLHWFQAGDEGAIVSEFSSRSRDDADIFTDQRIQRATKVADA
jgi:D-lyxose ketol-isomerase